MNQQSKLIAIAAVVLISLFFGGSYLYNRNQHLKNVQSAEDMKKILVKDHSPVYGNSNAPVVIVEFLDPECETCMLFYPFVKNLMSEHPGKIKLVVRYAPFHQNAMMVVKILEAARLQDKYWETLSLLFERQPEWGSHHHPAPELIWTYLPQVGLNVKKIKADMEKPEVLGNIQTDMEDLKALGITKTPTFYVNGQPLESFGYEQLRSAVVRAIGNM
jgi:protein-disulfide isomerase